MPILINNSNIITSGKIELNPFIGSGPPYLTGYWVQTDRFPNSTSITGSTTISPMWSNISKPGQLAFGETYYSDSALTTPITASTLNMSAFSRTQGGLVNKSFRLSSTNGPIGLMNAPGPLTTAYGYLVASGTKINVGNSTQAWFYDDDFPDPIFVGGFFYTSQTKSWSAGTYAWALLPNTVATHLVTVDGTSGWPIISAIS
jgi:hypothetical protein